MTAITIPASMKALFQDVSGPVPVRDEEGNTLGTYTPLAEATKQEYEWAKKQFTSEELERSRRSGIAGTTDEVLRRIGVR